MTVGVKDTVERGKAMSEQELLVKFGVTTEDGSKIMTDFNSNMLEVAGTYKVTLNAVDVDGNKAKPVEVTITVEKKYLTNSNTARQRWKSFGQWWQWNKYCRESYNRKTNRKKAKQSNYSMVKEILLLNYQE